MIRGGFLVKDKIKLKDVSEDWWKENNGLYISNFSI